MHVPLHIPLHAIPLSGVRLALEPSRRNGLDADGADHFAKGWTTNVYGSKKRKFRDVSFIALCNADTTGQWHTAV